MIYNALGCIATVIFFSVSVIKTVSYSPVDKGSCMWIKPNPSESHTAYGKRQICDCVYDHGQIHI